MFTGIVTDVGTVRSAEQRGDLRLVIGTGYDLDSVDLGASIACSGVCLTVVDKGDDWFAVDRVGRNRLANRRRSVARRAQAQPRALAAHGRRAWRSYRHRPCRCRREVVGRLPEGDSTRVGLSVPRALGPMIAAKGSIALDGVSLTVNEVRDAEDGTTHFSVNIIPHTAQHTTLGESAAGRQLNVEVDVLARYLDRMLAARAQ